MGVSDEHLRVHCMNEECVMFLVVVVLWPGETAECKICGRFMPYAGVDDG